MVVKHSEDARKSHSISEADDRLISFEQNVNKPF